MKIIPAIIPDSFKSLDSVLKKIIAYTSEVQVDVVDGIFVSNTSWPYTDDGGVAALTPLAQIFDIELDLMVKEPETVIDSYMAAGIQRVVVHIESTTRIEEILAHRKNKGYVLGLSLNNDTALESILEYIPQVDFVQCMGIAEIGSQGQSFDDRVLARIELLRNTFPDLEISVDGSVNKDTIPKLVSSGADRLVVGSAILRAVNPAQAFEDLQKLVSSKHSSIPKGL